ncbi:MAG: ABC transporter permease [Bacteroidota bacterium]
MLYNYLKVALRNMWKRKLFSGINILGLAIAVASSILLLLTTFFEFSFDRFHEDSDRIYRVYIESVDNDGLARTANLPSPMGMALEDEVSGLEAVCRWTGGSAAVQYEGVVYDQGIRYVDENFLSIFSFEMLKGDPETALKDLNSVLISERSAERIFGESDPIGQTIEVSVEGSTRAMVVQGVIETQPENSSLNYSLLTRFENVSRYELNKNRWDNYFLSVYVKAKEEATLAGLMEESKAIVDKYMQTDILQLEQRGVSTADGEALISIGFQPLSDLHFDTVVGGTGIAKAFPIALAVIAMFILSIACINFINLTLGSALNRAKEVGVRKVVGASRGQLVVQFWGEVLLLVGFAILAGLAFAQILLPHFNTLFRLQIELYHPRLFLVLGSILLFVGLIGGAYPALVLSRFQPAAVLKGITRMQKPGVLRNFLVLLQFVFSILLIICTLIIGRQISYLSNKPLGFDKAQVVSIPVGDELRAEKVAEQLGMAWESESAIHSITTSYGNLGMGKDNSRVRSVMGFEQDGAVVSTHWNQVGYDYFETLGIPIVEGRSFSRAFPTDTSEAVIINRTFAKQLSEESAVGMMLEFEPPKKVVGVMEDFHFESLTNTIQPLTLALGADKDFSFSYIFVRVANENLPATLALMEKTWKARYPQSAFNPSFLDENNDRMYRSEQKLGQIFMSASTLAILLSCMGLFGIAMLVITQRTKEIGVRKVLGAPVSSIVVLVTKDFLKLVGIAFVIASPLAWYAMRYWLDNYAYSQPIEWWVFIVAGVLAFLIALITLSWQAYRAAIADPVLALRDE